MESQKLGAPRRQTLGVISGVEVIQNQLTRLNGLRRLAKPPSELKQSVESLWKETLLVACLDQKKAKLRIARTCWRLRNVKI